MKKISILFTALVLCIGLSAQQTKGVNFEDLTFSQALAKAKSNKKGPNVVFLDCYTTWCGPCKHMTEKVFPLEEAGKYFNANFVNIKIDMEKGEGIDIAKKYGIRAYPTFLVLDGDGKEVSRIVGGGEVNDFIERVKNSLDPAKSPAALKAAYEKNKTLNTALPYIESLSAAYKQDEIEIFINTEFNSFNERDKYSDKLWKYISQTMSSTNSPTLPFVVEHKSSYDQMIGHEKVNNALISAYKSNLVNYLSGKNKLPTEQLDKCTTSLSLLVNDDPVANYYILLANHYAKGEMDKITGLFHPGAFSYSCTEMQKSQIERAFTSIKEMPKEKVKEYYEAKAKMYKSMAESFEKQAEKAVE